MQETLTILLTKLEKDHRKLGEYIAFIQRCAQRFPSLRTTEKDRWGHYRLIADEVAREATHFRINRSCGCCDDASLYIDPYLSFGADASLSETRFIYSSTPIPIGTGVFLAVTPEEIEEKLKAEHYTPELIAKVVAYVKEHEAMIAEGD